MENQFWAGRQGIKTQKGVVKRRDAKSTCRNDTLIPEQLKLKFETQVSHEEFYIEILSWWQKDRQKNRKQANVMSGQEPLKILKELDAVLKILLH